MNKQASTFTFGGLLGLTILITSGGLKAQQCPFNVGRDTVLCAGQSILLAGPGGALSVVWQETFAQQYLTADASGLYWCTATFPNNGDNIVANGSFDQGIANFTTDLTIGIGGTWGPLSLEGTYGVTTDPSILHSNFSSCGDHTGGGSMLLLNGSASPGESIWCQTVAVTPNTSYAFSAWLMSASPDNPAELTFAVNGVSLGTPLLAAAETCIWDEFYAVWNSGNSTTADICITNLNLQQSGNDFALDDVSFAPLCTFTDTVQVTILPSAPDVVVTGEEGLCANTSGTLQATLYPADWPLNDVVYAWSNGASSSAISIPGPGSYAVEVTGRCLNAAASFQVVEELCVDDLTMPNVFTPNGDGRNDRFAPILIGKPSDYLLEVHNRWGQLVHSSKDPNRGWDGRNEGNLASDGTYFWIVRFQERSIDGAIAQRVETGHVTLLNGR